MRAWGELSVLARGFVEQLGLRTSVPQRARIQLRASGCVGSSAFSCSPARSPQLPRRSGNERVGRRAGQGGVSAAHAQAAPVRGSPPLFGQQTLRALVQLCEQPAIDGARKCKGNFCVHWVTTTADKAPAGWADTTLSQMNKIWAYEVGKLKFRAPMTDGKRGGNKKFDVYLKNVAPKGYAGYCAKERSIGGGYLASSYCVLDNDFLPSEFGDRPALGQPQGDRRARVLPRRPDGLRQRRGRLAGRVDRDLDGGALRRRRQRQPQVPPRQPGRRPGRAARRGADRRHPAVRQLGLVGVPQQPARHRHRPVGVDEGGRVQGRRPHVLHPGGRRGPQEEGRLQEALRQLRLRQRLPRRRPTPRARPGASPLR